MSVRRQVAWLLALVVSGSACDRGKGVDPALAQVRLVNSPQWFVVPAGAPPAQEDQLYFSTVVSNPSDETLLVGLSFRAYNADGTPHSGCFAPGDAGAGVTNVIQAGARARFVCTRGTIPAGTRDLQVTTRLEVVSPAAAIEHEEVSVIDAALRQADNTDEGEWRGSATARVSSKLEIDGTATVRFHFYDSENVQIATCQSYPTVIQREVAVRVTCANPPMMPPGAVPVRVAAELAELR